VTMEDDASQPLSVRTVFPGHPVLDGARVECAHRLCANDRHAVVQLKRIRSLAEFLAEDAA
jgi:hypothetical protein